MCSPRCASGGQRRASMEATVGDAARLLGERILAALRDLPPANTVPQPLWVRLGAEAERRGMSTKQFRAWCLSHRVEIRDESTRIAWVQPAQVDAAISGLPVARRAPSRQTRTELDQLVDQALDQRHGHG